LEDRGMYGWIILNLMLDRNGGRGGGRCVDWIHVAYGRDQWQAVLNAEINLQV
jgi:hypothetical protein